ncbi:hypothetical protein MKW92_012485 [Papaver armeniacum]|nr:hypothetical protein MKW92_012485 [Papaver armeniacum]
MHFVEKLDFSKHLSLGNNKKSDYDALKSWLDEDIGRRITKLVNCQGVVVYWDFFDRTGTWSQVEEHDSIFYRLPGIINPRNQEDERKDVRVSSRLAEISSLNDKLNTEVRNLQRQLNKQKNDRQAPQVSDLAAKFVYWSRVEEDDSIFYSLPGIINHSDTKMTEKRAAEKKMSELVAQNSILKEKLKEQLNREKKISELAAEISALKDKLNTEVTYLQEQLNQEKNDRQVLQAQLELIKFSI